MPETKSDQTLAPITIDGVEYEDLGYCRTPHGGIHGGGPVIHTVYCRLGTRWGDSATSGSECIRPGQDGAAIAAKRESDAERRRFTPPEYRAGNKHTPGPAITYADPRRQRTEILALRGRPRTADGSGEWTTWEVYDIPMGTSFRDVYRAVTSPGEPREMSAEEAATIVAEFNQRLPHYEFTIVRARLVIEEERLA